MKIGFIGLGKLGLPCALAIEDKGHEVCGYDVDPSVKQIIKTKKIPYEEEGAQELLDKSNIKFCGMEKVVAESEIIFVPIQTPHDPLYEGATRIPESRVDFDYTALKTGMQDLSDEIKKQGNSKVVIIISTVLPGTVEREIKPLLSKYVKICYNPFFIAMGTTVEDFLYPEFILFGVDDDDAAAKAEAFYKTVNNAPFYKTSIKNAELIKVGYNTFIGMKIVFANTLMEICHKIGANVDEVTDGIKMGSKRIMSPMYFSGGMGDGGGCLPPDQLIYTENGIRKIEDIEEGDMVFGGDGRLHRVLATYKRPYKGKLIGVKSRGVPITWFTPEHPLVVSKDTRRKYETTSRGKQIQKYVNTNIDVREKVGKQEEVPVGALTKHFYTMFPSPKIHFETFKHEMYYALEDYLELAGYYLSEGCIDNGKRIEFCMHEKEQEYLKRIEELIGNIYPDPYTSRMKKTGSKAESVRFCKVELARQLEKDFGKLAENKKIPGWILYGGPEFAKLLLKGIFRGDGSSHSEGFSFSTISENMAYGVSLLLRKLGIIHTIVNVPERTGKDNVFHRKAYEVRIRNAAYISSLASIVDMPIRHKMQEKRYPNVIFQKGNFFYHHIQEICFEDYEGTVFNLNVDGTHDYVTPVGLVKNCHPRDNIALSWLARELELSHDWFDDLMSAREDQTEWLADLMEEYELPKVILGKAFKPNINLTVGSPSILLKNILEERGHRVEMYDPYIDNRLPTLGPSVFLIGTKHPEFVNFRFPPGSVVLDPWRYIPESPGVTVIGIGK